MDPSDPRVVDAFDDLPLWSAPFGLRLLERVRMAPGLRVVDLGCGAGFPILELAERLGPSCRAIGVDPWAAGLARAQRKAAIHGVAQVSLVRGVGEHLPLADGCVDTIVSNNGLNNVHDPRAVLAECRRVSRPGAQLVATMNLPGTMEVFYRAFEATLVEAGLGERVEALRRHRHDKRKPAAETAALLRVAGFTVEAEVHDTFTWRFLDGRALFRHSFVRLGFLDAWQDVLDPIDVPPLFAALEARLDAIARQRGELALEVPFVSFNCRRD
jgi:arsenite methyltransferase